MLHVAHSSHRTRLMELAQSLGLLTLMLQHVGCAVGDLADNEYSETCIVDDECTADDVCVLGLCVDLSEQDMSLVHVEVRPPSDSGLLTQQTFFVDLTQEERTQIRLRSSATLNGAIRLQDGTGIDARLVALPATFIEGRGLVESMEVNTDGQFSLPLLESETYRFEVYPADSSLPPYFHSGHVLLAGDTEETLDIVFSPQEDQLSISGVLTAGEGVASIPIQGLEVQIHQDGRRISSTDYSDNEGFFQVNLPAGVYSDVELQIRPTDENPTFPQVTHLLEALSTSEDLAEISVGAIATPVEFSGRVLGPDMVPVPGASIFVQGDVGDGFVKRLFVTDEEGAFLDALSPGQYEVRVLAPISSTTAGMLREERLDISVTSSPLEFRLPPRTPVSGEIVNSEGNPVANASIRLERISAVGSGALVNSEEMVWSFYSVTDAQGSFSADVDVGRYRIHVEPETADATPIFTTIVDVYSEPDPILLQIPPSLLVAGRLEQPSTGEPLANATIRIFTSFTNEFGDAIKLGEGQSDAQGHFGLSIPDLELD